MPELPDVTIYVEALRERIVGAMLAGVRILSPFVLRTFDPPAESVVGHTVRSVDRMGKRVVLALDGELWIVIHLMIAGRLRWASVGAKPPAKITLAGFSFAQRGELFLTEASQKKRASLHVLCDAEAVAALNPNGLDVLASGPQEFAAALTKKNRTLKRALTDPHAFDCIGNAYSDEILHEARLSPVQLTSNLSPEEIARLHGAAKSTLIRWTDALRKRFAGRFPGPGEITAFRPEFAVHGRFGQTCPVCGAAVQRIRYAENETNYCPGCQTEGRILRDRSLSRLLKDDWPATLEELES